MRCLNRTDAYQEAYPKATRETARRGGSALMTNHDIAAYIDARMAELTIKPAEILRRMSDMATASLKPFIRITGEGFVYFDFSDPEAQDYLYLIKKIESKRTRRWEGSGENAQEWEDEWVKVELYDAKDALEKLGKQHKLFTDHVDLTSDGKALPLEVHLYMPENKREDDGGE